MVRRNFISTLIFAVVVIFGITAFISCEKEEEALNYPDLTPEQFEYVGEEHNNGLDYIYESLKMELNKLSQKTSWDGLFGMVNKYCNEFYSKSQLTKDFYSLSVAISENQINATKLFYENNLFQNNNEVSFIDSCINNGNFTDIQKNLLFELMNKIENAEEISDVSAIMSDINIKATQLISDSTELSIIFITTNVMNYSCTYWYEHFDEWNNLFSSGLKAAEDESKFNWKSFGKADVVGAAGGAAAGAIAGSVAPGPGTLAGAGIGGCAGGIGGSVGDAVGQLWDRWIK